MIRRGLKLFAVIGLATCVATGADATPKPRNPGKESNPAKEERGKPLAAKASTTKPEVTVAGMVLRGVAQDGGVRAFMGIPYATPPVGDKRWRVSTLAHPDPGPRDATRPGAVCPQDGAIAAFTRRLASALNTEAGTVATPPMREDCLFLNVWAPRADKTFGARPVMVWLHGGSNSSGAGSDPLFRGTKLAARGAVVVTLNYRLGPLGFLAHPALGDVSAGRQGLSDQITALRWVRDNIAAFGGDPKNVTLIGESAGGTDVLALMRIAVAQGLFARAIVQSAWLGDDAFADKAAATRAGIALLGRDASATALAQRPAADLVRLWADKRKGQFAAPLVPDDVAFRVPLMIGTNDDEYRLFLPTDPAMRGHGEAVTLAALPRAGEVARLLQKLSNDGATRADLLASAPAFHCPTVAQANANLAAGVATWVYRFERVRPGAEAVGAYHGAEIPYLFDTAPRWLPGDAVDRALGEVIARYWLNFATSGDPNQGATVPRWPRWSAGADAPAASAVLHLGATIRAAPTADLGLCPLLASSTHP